jgi:phage terminase large subunit-like protein
MSVTALNRQLSELQSFVDGEGTDEKAALIEEWAANILPSINSFSDSEARQIQQCNSHAQLKLLLSNNLFLMMVALCGRKDMLNTWCYERCGEIQEHPDGYLDLWARDHYKSTIITFGRSLFDIINTHGSNTVHPCTIGIFSFTRPIAKAFLRQIKLELERNQLFNLIFPEIFWKNPKSESAKWSEDEGLLMKRSTNPKEATIEAWGLIEGQPTSKHFNICVYDDMITHDTARTKYSMEMATRSWENSLNLSTKNGVRRYVGTRKHLADTYSIILERKAAVKRLYTPYTDAAEKEGVLLNSDELMTKRREMGEITFASEMLQEPLRDSAMGLNQDMIQNHELKAYGNIQLFMVCDPASGKNKKSDYTVYAVFGVDPETNLLLIDGIRDRLNPTQRWNALQSLYLKYPAITKIFYEEAGMNEDLFLFKNQMNATGRYFDSKFDKLKPLGSKENRILRLEPWLSAGRFYAPATLPKISVSQSIYDFVAAMKEEMAAMPFPPHDDILDVTGYAVQKIEADEIKPKSQKSDISTQQYYERAQNRGNLFR